MFVFQVQHGDGSCVVQCDATQALKSESHFLQCSVLPDLVSDASRQDVSPSPYVHGDGSMLAIAVSTEGSDRIPTSVIKHGAAWQMDAWVIQGGATD